MAKISKIKPWYELSAEEQLRIIKNTFSKEIKDNKIIKRYILFDLETLKDKKISLQEIKKILGVN
jgi:hypothetical protein